LGIERATEREVAAARHKTSIGSGYESGRPSGGIFYAGVTNRSSRLTKPAIVAALTESPVFAVNGRQAVRSKGWLRSLGPRAAGLLTSSFPLVRRPHPAALFPLKRPPPTVRVLP
jgi:hypothetical protein